MIHKLVFTLLCWLCIRSPANANEVIGALEQRLASGQQLDLSTNELIEVIQSYDQCSADLRNTIWKQLPLSKAIPTLSIERWLNPMGERHSPPTIIRIDALRMLSIRKDPRALAALWTIYTRSRLNVLPEDPDLFERALDVIIAIADANPEQSSLFFKNHAGNTLVDALSTALSSESAEQLRGWRKNTKSLESIAPINHQLSDQWQSGGSSWLKQTQSAEGSLGIEIIRLALFQIASAEHDEPLKSELQELAKKHNVNNPLPSIVLSMDKPGQLGTLEAPAKSSLVPHTPPRGSVTNASKSMWPFALIILAMIAPGPIKRKWLRGLCLGGGLFLIFDQTAPKSEGKALLKRLSRPLTIFENVSDAHGRTLRSEGAYLRAQQVRPQSSSKRVVVIGASSAHGSNLLRENVFSSQLEQKINSRPGLSSEFINLGVGGANSNILLEMSDTIISLNPTLVILYYGHNEISQSLSYAPDSVSSEQLWVSLWSQSRSFRTLSSWITSEQPSTSESQPSSLSIVELRALKNHALLNAHQNLSALLRQLSAAKISVLMLSPPTNIPFAPVRCLKTGAELSATVNQLDPAKQARWIEQRLSELPPDSADACGLRPLLVESLRSSGEGIKARSIAQLHIDHGAEITTITQPMKKLLYQLAAEHQTGWLDLDLAFSLNSPDGYTTNGLFWDELHPSILGHRYIAELIYPWVEKQLRDQRDGGQ